MMKSHSCFPRLRREMKSEIRNPKAERNPKPEVRFVGAVSQGWRDQHIQDTCLASDFGFQISFGLRELGIRISS